MKPQYLEGINVNWAEGRIEFSFDAQQRILDTVIQSVLRLQDLLDSLGPSKVITFYVRINDDKELVPVQLLRNDLEKIAKSRGGTDKLIEIRDKVGLNRVVLSDDSFGYLDTFGERMRMKKPDEPVES